MSSIRFDPRRLYRVVRCILMLFISGCLFPRPSQGQFLSIELEEEPLQYSKTDANNRVSKLVSGLAEGRVELKYDEKYGYLRSLLTNLEIPVSSQVLVFSKTSLQVQHISPRNPRAIFFNDDTYVGWVHGSSLVEVSTSDPRLGTAFYAFTMTEGSPRIRQETYQCLSCHATTMTKGVPGHTVRSGYPTYDGVYDPKRESFVSDDSSDFKQRWGGWYVTGSHGEMRHMGNAYLRGGELDTLHNGNRQSLDDLFSIRNYPSPHSDIQALMVLEHQTQMHNIFTCADFNVRTMLHEASNQDQAEHEVRLRWIAKEVVDRLFFCKEFPLTAPVAGSGEFERDFVARGPKDANGRSLRDFDMRTRMFKYPLSYLVYSEAFDALQPALRQEIRGQLTRILSGENQGDEYRHLTAELRGQIREIVQATKPEFLE